MVNLVDLLLKTESPKDSLKNISNNDSDNKEFGILFETMVNEINKVNTLSEDRLVQKEDDYKIEIVIENSDKVDTFSNISKPKENLKDKKDDYNDLIVKTDKKLDHSIRMNIFLGKLNNYLKENIETLKDNQKLSFSNEPKKDKKIEIKVSQFSIQLQDKIRRAIEDFRNFKLNENDFKTLLNKIIKSDLVKELKIDGKIKNVKIKKVNEEERKIKNSGLNRVKEKLDERVISDNIKNVVENKKESSIELKDKKENLTKLEQYFLKLKEETKVSDSKIEIKNDNINLINEKSLNFEIKNGIDSTQKISYEQKQELFNQIVKNTKILLTNSETKFSTMIRPESLGRMDFHINIKDGQLNGKIIVHTKDAFDFFRSNVEELRAVFQKGNVEFGKIDIALAGQMDDVKESIAFSNNNFNNNSDQSNNRAFYNEITGINSNYYKYPETKLEESIENKIINNYSNSKINLLI